MKKKIQLGIIGKNFGYNVLYKSLKNNNNFKVTAFCMKSKVASVNLPKNIKLYNNWKNLIKDKKIQAVLIVTPPFLHKKIISFAIKYNKHIFCEKPCCISALQNFDVIKRVQKNENFISHMVNYEIAELSAFKLFNKIINSQKIKSGSLNWIIFNNTKKKNWKNNHKQGGGLIFNFYCHSLFYLEKMFGDITSTKIKLKNNGFKEDKFLKGDVIFNSGLKINVRLLIGQKSQHKRGVHKISLKTNKYIYELKSGTQNLSDQFTINKYLLKRKNSYKNLYKEKKSLKDFRIKPSLINLRKFAKSIREKKINNPSFYDALRIHKIIEKSIISSKKNKRVSIN